MEEKLLDSKEVEQSSPRRKRHRSISLRIETFQQNSITLTRSASVNSFDDPIDTSPGGSSSMCVDQTKLFVPEAIRYQVESLDDGSIRCRTTSRSSTIGSIVGSLVGSMKRLRKTIGCCKGFSLISSVIIGSGIFISPSLVLREVHDVGVSLSIWLVSGMLALFGALSYVELATTIRKAGGSYSYVLYIYGPAPAFLISWTQSLLIDPTCISAITLSLGSYVAKPFANLIIVQPWHAKVIAACCILIMFLTNCTTTKAVTNLQTFINCAQISMIAFIIVVGVWQLSVGHTHHFKNAFGNGEFSPGRLGSYGTAFFGALWAYNGWNTIGNITEDMIDLEKTVFRTIISAVPFVICSYFVVNVAFLTVLPPDVIANSSTVAVDFVENVFGKDVAYFIPILVAVSCYGSANGNLFAASRVPMSAGREGHMPSLLGTIHRKRHTPIPALLLTTIIALFLLLPEGSNMESLINLASVSCMFVYGITILGVIVLRVKQPELYRPCKVWIILPGIMVVVFAALVVFAFFQRPGNSALAAGIILLGLPVYFVLVRPGKHLPRWLSRGIRKLTDVVKEKMNLVPCSA